MEFIGLIRIEFNPQIRQTLIYITEKGLEEYKKQTYHILAANLLEAEESRRLSRRTLYLAIVSVVIAVVSIVIAISKG